MRKYVLLVLVSLTVAFPARARAQAAEPGIDAVVREALKAFDAPGAAVAIVRDDKVIYLKGHGVRRLGSEQPVTPDTLFAIASCTKAFTTASIALLIQDGKMRWDDPVRKHLPYFHLSDPLADRDVTLRDLVCHRTGLSRHELLWYRAPWGLEETVRRAALVKPSSSFRSRYEYANIPYIAAGLAVASASKSTWHEFVRQRIFKPLGLKGAVFTAAEVQNSPDFATPHSLDAEGKLQPIAWYPDQDQIRGSGSIKAGVRDLACWLRFQLGDGAYEGKRLLTPALLREVHTPQVVISPSARGERFPEEVTNFASYGLGWWANDYRGHWLVSHGGSADGFRSVTMLVPKARLGLVVLTNRNPSSLPDALGKTLVDLLLQLPSKDWNAFHLAKDKKADQEKEDRLRKRQAERHPGTKPSLELSAYTGSYREPAYGELKIALEENGLHLSWSSFAFPLVHFHFDTFTASGDPRLRTGNLDDRVVFRLGGDGQVESVGFAGQEFRKVRPPRK